MMSYIDELSQEQIDILTPVNISIKEYYDNAKLSFHEEGNEQLFSTAELTIENKIFTANCDFTGKFECSLRFDNCYFLRTSIIYDGEFNKLFSLKDCFFEDEIRIAETTEFKGGFDLITLNIRRPIYVNGGKYKTCRWSLVNGGSLIVNGGHFENLIVGFWGGTNLKELHFDFRKISGQIKVSGMSAKIETLLLFQFSLDVSFAIEDISVNCLSIYRFRNEKTFRLLNIKKLDTDKPSEFTIAESYLGKSEFYSIDFSSFDSVNILDAHLVDCTFVNTKWPEKIEALKGRYIGKTSGEEKLPEKIHRLESRLYENITEKNELEKDPEVKTYYEKKRETLRQLKYAMYKQGDLVNEQKFHALEMIAHDKTLSWKNNFWTKYIIKFSHHTSDFGQSIHKPLIGLFTIHFILFFILLLAGVFTPLHISVDHSTSQGFWKGFYQYFRLINPLRKADDTFNNGFIFIDLLMRVWSSFMIYNIIRATRRFIK